MRRKYSDSIQSLGSYYNNLKLKNRHFFMRPLKNCGLSLSFLRSLGYSVSKHLWRNLWDSSNRNLGNIFNS